MIKINKKLYLFLLVTILSSLILSINYCKALYQCAAIFSIIVTICNTIRESYNKKNLIFALSFAIILSIICLNKVSFYVNGKLIHNIMSISFLSIISSIYTASIVLYFINNRYKYIILPNKIVFLIIASILDSLIMTTCLYNGIFTIIYIIMKDICFKILYGLFIYSISTGLRFINKNYVVNNFNKQFSVKN